MDKERGREKQRDYSFPFNSVIGYQHSEKNSSTNKLKANACEPSLSLTQTFLCFSGFLTCLE